MIQWFWAVQQITSLILGFTLVFSGNVNIVPEARPFPTPEPTTIPVSPSPTPTPPPANKNTIVRAKISSLNDDLNTYRRAHGLPELKTRDDLCQSAERRNSEIKSDFSHQGFGEAFAGIPFKANGENIWQGNPYTNERVIESWDNSAGHRANMLGDWIYGCGVGSGMNAVFLFMR